MLRRRTGLVLHEPAKCHPGYTLFAPDHGRRVCLIDMEGNIVHEWRVPTVHHAVLLPNHHLLHDTQFDEDFPTGIRELDWDGNEVWFYECLTHHDAQRLANGNTIILAHEPVNNPAVYTGGLIEKNTKIIEVTPEKQVVWEWYSDRHIEELTRLVGVQFPLDKMDWTHSNSVQVLPDTPSGRSDARFKAGNVLISHRTISTIAVIERETGEVVWAYGPGNIDFQHHANMIDTGHILVFDNGTHRDYSRVIELNPVTEQIVWEFKDDPPQRMHAKYLSGQQRLPNGNTFICAGGMDNGRMLEVTPDCELVWDYLNPFGRRARGRTKVYRAYRYEPEFIDARL
ncbi:MAG: aryl-sulfate sulfotransferase [Armatimonadota bacterium]|jgi:hypothetical protein